MELNQKSPLIQSQHRKYSPKDVNQANEAVKRKIEKRQALSAKRCYVNDVATALALLGIALIVVATELIFNDVIGRGSAVHTILESAVTISTIILLFLVLWYHYLDVQLYMIVHHKNNWRLVVDTRYWLSILLELVACAVHPFPGIDEVHLGESGHLKSVTDLLTMLMFLRLYLLFRYVVLHSSYGRDLAVQTFTAYNNISIDVWFVLKSVLNTHPVQTLSAIVAVALLMAAWFMRICESTTPESLEDYSYANCLWMIAITFLTVGYGDIYPTTPSGRGVAIVLGVFGVGCTALLIGVVSNKLELSRTEKFLSNFIADTSLRKHMKSLASDIIKHAWWEHTCRKTGKTRNALVHAKKLQVARQEWRNTKRAIIELSDDNASIEAIYKEQTSNSKQMLELRKSRTQEAEMIQQLHDRITLLSEKLDMITSLVTGKME